MYWMLTGEPEPGSEYSEPTLSDSDGMDWDPDSPFADVYAQIDLMPEHLFEPKDAEDWYVRRKY
jgi:hypothetical protein